MWGAVKLCVIEVFNDDKILTTINLLFDQGLDFCSQSTEVVPHRLLCGNSEGVCHE